MSGCVCNVDWLPYRMGWRRMTRLDPQLDTGACNWTRAPATGHGKPLVFTMVFPACPMCPMCPMGMAYVTPNRALSDISTSRAGHPPQLCMGILPYGHTGLIGLLRLFNHLRRKVTGHTVWVLWTRWVPLVPRPVGGNMDPVFSLASDFFTAVSEGLRHER